MEVPRADPDIAGIGVIISFVVTIVITLGLAFDIMLRTRSQLSSIVKRKILLGFSDQLLVTSVGIQIAALIKLSQLSFYHHNIISTIATVSTVTHILTIFLLREYFRTHHLIRRIRVAVMSVNLFFVVSNSVIAYVGVRTFHPAADPVSNVFLKDSLRTPDFDLIVSHVGASSLWFGICTGLWYMQALLLTAYFYIVLSITYLPDSLPRIISFIHGPRNNRRAWIRCALLLFSVFLYLPLIQTSFMLSKFRRGPDQNRADSTESQWGYGQICSLILMSMPVLNAITIYSEEYDNLHTRPVVHSNSNAVEPQQYTDIASITGINASAGSNSTPLQQIRRRDTEQRVGETASPSLHMDASPTCVEGLHQE